MELHTRDFKHKEVINVLDGTKIGFVDDMIFELESGRILCLVVFGRRHWLRFFEQDDDLSIPWDDVDVIGSDTLLVKCTTPHKTLGETKRSKKWFTNPINWK